MYNMNILITNIIFPLIYLGPLLHHDTGMFVQPYVDQHGDHLHIVACLQYQSLPGLGRTKLVTFSGTILLLSATEHLTTVEKQKFATRQISKFDRQVGESGGRGSSQISP